MSPRDRRIERELLLLLDARAPSASVCPSEVARAALGEAWRDGMEDVRRAARRLAAAGVVELTQRGRMVEPTRIRGPIRIRRRR